MEADKELKLKDDELSTMRSAYEDKEEEVLKLEADVESLKYALSGKRTNSDNETAIKSLNPLRNAVTAAFSGKITLEQILHLIGALFPDRVIITDTAFNSAANSHSFQYCARALDLLISLVTIYWEALASGQPDSKLGKFLEALMQQKN